MPARRKPRPDPIEPDPVTPRIADPQEPPSRWRLLLAGVLLVGAALVPLYVSRNGEDVFRYPKQLVQYAFAIVAAAVFLVGLLLRKLDLDEDVRARLRVPSLIAAAGMGWTILSTLTSTNRLLSVDALVWAASLVAIFLLSIYTFRGMPVSVIALAVFLPATVNAIVLTLQALQIWNPWRFPEGTVTRLMRNAMLGNPDDVGVYLAIPALFALALAIAGGTRWRAFYAVMATALLFALFTSETLTAILAVTAAVTVMMIRWRPRVGIVFAMLVPMVMLSAALLYAPTKRRFDNVVLSIRTGNWGWVITGRLVPFVTAVEMFRDEPVTGVGPGCFKYHYMQYRIDVESRYPRIATISRTMPVNFAEAHNDHLQILAEVGLPGYLGVIAALVLVALPSFRRRPYIDDAAEVAWLYGLPLAVSVFVIMMAQFALQLAAPAYTYAILGGACLAWRQRDVGA